MATGEHRARRPVNNEHNNQRTAKNFSLMVGLTCFILLRLFSQDWKPCTYLPLTTMMKNVQEPSSNETKNELYFDNVVLLGQFNYNLDAELVVRWVQKWQSVFRFVQVRGPFNRTTLSLLKSKHNVDAYWGDDDLGYSSPMQNLAHALRMYLGDDRVVGILQVHDDMLLNITHLVHHFQFPSTNQVLSQAPPIVLQQPITYFSTVNGTGQRLTADQPWIPADAWPSNNWRWWPLCMTNMAQAASLDIQGHNQYSVVQGDSHKVVPMWANAKGDFQYIPMSYARPAADMLDWLAKHKVFLECAVPTLHGYLQQQHNTKIQFVEYCEQMNKPAMRFHYLSWVFQDCLEHGQKGQQYFPVRAYAKPPFGIVHPVKLTAYGPDVWDEYFDKVAFGK